MKDDMYYEQRWDFIRPHIVGKRVLELGPAELVGTVNADKVDRWLHGRVCKEAARVVGLEYSGEQVAALSARGYDIRQGDAQSFELGEQFDVILAGEVIEHLSNPGLFLDCARRHLVPGGKLVLTTPNRYGVRWIYNVLKTGDVPRYTKPIAKHVLYFDSDSLESLLERHEFNDVEIHYCKWVGARSNSRGSQLMIDATARWRPAMLPVLMAVAQRV